MAWIELTWICTLVGDKISLTVLIALRLDLMTQRVQRKYHQQRMWLSNLYLILPAFFPASLITRTRQSFFLENDQLNYIFSVT